MSPLMGGEFWSKGFGQKLSVGVANKEPILFSMQVRKPAALYTQANGASSTLRGNQAAVWPGCAFWRVGNFTHTGWRSGFWDQMGMRTGLLDPPNLNAGGVASKAWYVLFYFTPRRRPCFTLAAAAGHKPSRVLLIVIRSLRCYAATSMRCTTCR